MRAVIANGNGMIHVADVRPPETGDYDCLVKMRSCLFCNSTDRHIVEKSFDFGIAYPCVLGHESLGMIVSTGKKVKNFKEGDWVLRPYAVYPDETADGTGSGWGGFAEFGKIRDFQAMSRDGVCPEKDIPNFFRPMQRLPSGLNPEKCMMASCVKEIFSSTKKIDTRAAGTFLVCGAGAAGCLFAHFLKLAGAAHVTITARRREQLDFALKNTPVDEAEELDKIKFRGRVFDALVDTSGCSTLAESLLRVAIKKEGRFHSYAVYPEMSRPDFFDRFKRIAGFERIDPDEASVHDEVCRTLMEGTLDFQNYITRSFGIEEAQEAWRTVKEKTTMKTAIVFP